MEHIKFIIRVLVFGLGLELMAFGVSFSAKGLLGTNPIAAMPYSLSLYFTKISFGTWIIIFNLSFIFIELVLIKNMLKLYNIMMQVISVFRFWLCIDISMFFLREIETSNYFYPILLVVT